MVKSYDVPETKKKLFKSAIENQFNAFKVQTTLGQYGAVFAGLSVIPNPQKTDETHPDYLPEISLAPSIMYGVLKDVFGEDQANESFKKLLEEFGGNIKDLENGIADMAGNIYAKKSVKPLEHNTGIANFKIHNTFHPDRSDPKLAIIQKNLVEAIKSVHDVTQVQLKNKEERTQILETLKAWRAENKKGEGSPFSEFISDTILPIIDIENSDISEQLILLSQSVAIQGVMTDDQYKQIQNSINSLLLSQEEYMFMTGTKNPNKLKEFQKSMTERIRLE